MFLRRKKAQSTAEYAIIIAIVVGALVAMQVYVKRGMQGRFKDAVEDLATNTTDLEPKNNTGPDAVDYGQYEISTLEQTTIADVQSESTDSFTKGQTTRAMTDAEKNKQTRSLKRVEGLNY